MDDPGVKWLIRQVEVAVGSGDERKAEIALNKLSKMDFPDRDVRWFMFHHLGLLALGRGKISDAEELFNQAIAEKSDTRIPFTVRLGLPWLVAKERRLSACSSDASLSIRTASADTSRPWGRLSIGWAGPGRPNDCCVGSSIGIGRTSSRSRFSSRSFWIPDGGVIA